MRKAFKVLSFLLVICVVLSLGTVGCKKTAETAYETTPIDVSAEYTPLVGKQNDWLNSNPDRGYRTEISFVMYDTAEYDPGLKNDWRRVNVNNSDDEIRKTIEKLVTMYLQTNVKVAIAYICFNDCNTMDQIPDKYLHALDLFFENLRARGVRVIWRHAYGGTTNRYITVPEDREYLEKVCANQDIMVKHIKQLGEYIGKNTDVVMKISSGVIGNGEYTASFQWPPVDFNVITDSIIRYMCVPNGLTFNVRLPRYKKDVIDWWAENHNGEMYPYADIIGHTNDAIYGETYKLNANSACYQIDHTPLNCKDGSKCYCYSEDYFDEWRYVTETAAYTSQCGEMFTNIGMTVVNKIFPTGLEVIKEMAHHRHSILSNWHTMGEKQDGKYGTAETNVMIRWVERETVTPELLDENGIIYDPNYFVDEDGNKIDRNPYEFIKDHLGYKLVAEGSNLKGELGRKGKLKVDLTFKNYGFAAAFYLTSGFAVLDSKYNVVTEVTAGNPDKWISLPADYYVTERNSSVQNDVISYTIDGELTLPEDSGKYHIAFFLKCDNGEGAALSNDIIFENGYNILHTVEIK